MILRSLGAGEMAQQEKALATEPGIIWQEVLWPSNAHHSSPPPLNKQMQYIFKKTDLARVLKYEHFLHSLPCLVRLNVGCYDCWKDLGFNVPMGVSLHYYYTRISRICRGSSRKIPESMSSAQTQIFFRQGWDQADPAAGRVLAQVCADESTAHYLCVCVVLRVHTCRLQAWKTDSDVARACGSVGCRAEVPFHTDVPWVCGQENGR